MFRKNNQVMTLDKYKKQRKRSCALNDHPSKYFFSSKQNNTKLVTISNNIDNDNGKKPVRQKTRKTQKVKKGSKGIVGKKPVRRKTLTKIKKTRRRKTKRKKKGKK